MIKYRQENFPAFSIDKTFCMCYTLGTVKKRFGEHEIRKVDKK